jgi:uncharacterized membrane protein
MTATPEHARTFVLAAYVLHLIGAIAGLPSLIGLIINYLQRNDSPERLATHHRWMIRSFWWGILWVFLGALLTLVVIGWAILGVVWLWYLYRHVRGLIALINDHALPI